MISLNTQAASDQIVEDPDAQAQLEIDKFKITVEFKDVQNLKTVTNLVQKSTNNLPTQYIAYYLLEFDKLNLELPVQLSTTDSLEASTKTVLNSQNTYFSNLLSAKNANQKDTITLGENELNLAELNSKLDLNELNQKTQEKNFTPKITKITFTKNGVSEYLNKFQTKENHQASNKKAIRQKKLDEIEGAKAKLEKDKRVAKTKIDRKAKKKEIKNKVLAGSSEQVSLEDIYFLGEEGKDFGFEILPPEKVGEAPRIKQDNSKIKNYKEDKTIAENIVDSIGAILSLGSVQTEAFSPEFYNEQIYHATPRAHVGTTIDLFSGKYWEWSNSWNVV